MKKILVLFAALFLFGCASAVVKEGGRDISPVGNTYYTKANIWYENPDKILAINWHLGAIIPVGTKVKIIRYGGNIIRFENESGASFTLINAKKHRAINTEVLFNQYFSKENVTYEGAFSKFTRIEQENIKKGSIAEGMSKEAILMAYGYPPSHRTPNLSADLWTYWENRIVRYLVYFQDNKVIKIVRTRRP